MSNSDNELKMKILSFLTDKKFPEIASNYIKNNILYNDVLAVHLLAIGLDSTGITAGGVSTSYIQRLTPIEEPFLRFNNGLHFYTTNGRLIENTNRCSNSSVRFRNEIFSASNTRIFRDEMNKYFEKHAKTIMPEDIKLNNYEKVELKYSISRRNMDSAKLNFYEKIVEGNKKIMSSIENIYLNVVLKKDINFNNGSKFKL